MSWKFYIYTTKSTPPGSVPIKAPASSLRSYFSYNTVTNCTVYPYLAWTNSRYFDYDTDGQNPMGRRIDRGSYTRYENIDFYNANESYGTNSSYGGTSNGDCDDSVAAFVVDNTTRKVYAVFWNQYAFSGYWVTSNYAGPGYLLTQLPNDNWISALNNAGVPGKKMTAAAAAAAAWTSLQSLSVPTTTTTISSANSTKSTAQGYWNTISQAGSGWTNYSAAQSKYNEIVTAVSNIEARDTRLNKKADKTELNTANTNVRVDYTTPHTRGTADYTSIKSTLTSVNKRLNS